jgi:hypothetical protein
MKLYQSILLATLHAQCYMKEIKMYKLMLMY